MAENKTRKGMVRFGVIRCDCNDRYNRKFHLSIISGEVLSLSVSEDVEFPFPFDKDENGVYGGSCGGWLCFHGCMGQILLWNLTSKISEALPPPPGFAPNDWDMLLASGMGYVAEHRDFKVIRHYIRINETIDDSGANWFAGADRHYEVWSFNEPFWRAIRGPFINFKNAAGVYVNVTGSCYWPATYNHNSVEYKSRCGVAKSGHSSSSDLEVHHVVSFDFATESFDHFPLPATTIRDARYSLVAYRGSLGALVYSGPQRSKSPKLSIELYVCSLKKKAWGLLYVVSQLADVARPLGLKDHRWLLLESKRRGDKRCQLKAYDLYAKTEEKLDIYDYPGQMNGFSYAESTDPPLPLPPLPRGRRRNLHTPPSIVGGSVSS